MKVSGIVHTRNSQATLERALKSLVWVDELIVVDMASADATLDIARRFTDRICAAPVAPRVDAVRNQFLEHATHEWILVLDSDEYLAEDAGDVLREYIQKYGTGHDAFALPRFNYIAGQIMRGSRWYPDHQMRLFRKGTVRWSDATHVPPVVLTGPHRVMELQPPGCPHIHHRNYKDLRDFIRKQADYALLDRYDPDPAAFDFSLYLAGAYEDLALRCDPEQDGDLSHALSLLMAWDAIIRGLIHWDSIQPRPPLGYLKALPVASGKVPWWRVRLSRWLARHYSFGFFARRLRERLRDWRWVAGKGKG